MSQLDLRDKNVLVVGLGKSGLAAARFLHRLKARVTVVDARSRRDLSSDLQSLPKSVRVKVGSKQYDPLSSDLIIVSPGVPWDQKELRRARAKGIPVLPEFELGWLYMKPKKTIAVTGTNGKTTTTALLGHILKPSLRNVVVGGNIGTPLTELALKGKKNPVLVFEISSYQIEAHHYFKPDIGVWLNLTPDHLGRHKTMSNYARIKARLFKNTTKNEWALLNRRDPWCRKMAKHIPSRKQWFPTAAARFALRYSRLPGRHNDENVVAAVSVAQILKIKKSSLIKNVKSFKGVEHRLQLVASKKGVVYINDSKSTNIDSTRVALEAMTSPTHLILGGQHKGSPYTGLQSLIKKKVKFVFAIGQAENLITKDLRRVVPVFRCRTLDRAVRQASQLAQKGETILLSPACASFDQYKNFEKRGYHFMTLVRKIKK